LWVRFPRVRIPVLSLTRRWHQTDLVFKAAQFREDLFFFWFNLRTDLPGGSVRSGYGRRLCRHFGQGRCASKDPTAVCHFVQIDGPSRVQG